MAATIDDKVVAMSFDSKKFESGVNDTLSALDKLKKALHFPGAGKGLEDVGKAAGRIDLSHIASGVSDVSSKLNALRLVAVAVFAEIAQKAVASAGRFVKAFTIDPAKAGFQEYATNLNAVQTILANTQAAGSTLGDVNAALLDLNKYSDKTIYNFSQMAKNIGTFTAAGVDLKTSTASIKGIANLAALSGSNAEQASTAMYQLSQAISAGQVHLQDWNSVVNAGMGGTVFQRALAQTAEAMGTIKKGAVELKGPMKNVSISGESFRSSLQSKPGEKSWLTSDVLTTTLKQFTGDLKDSELAAMGFNKEQIKAIQQTAKTAQHAATEVKTLSQVLDVAKETAGSGWAQTWQIVFGNFGEAKKTFTNLSNAINGFINQNAKARNKVLADWKALGGRTVLINSIKTAFTDLGLVVDKMKAGFRDVFPSVTGKNLYDLTLRFQKLMEAMRPGADTMRNIERTFRGVAAAFDIGIQVIKGVVTMFRHLFNAVGGGQGNVLQFSGDFATLIWRLDNFLKKGDKVNKFFAKMGDFLAKPLNVLKTLAHAIADLFSGFAPGGFTQKMDGMTKTMTPFERIMTAIHIGWGKFVDKFKGSDNVLQSIFDAITKGIKGFSEGLAKAVSGVNFEAVLQVIRTGLFAGIFFMLKKFLGKGSLTEQLASTGGGFIKNISGSLDALRGSMVAMQQNIKADTLKKIATSVGILAASVTALSLVDPVKLKGALAAMTVAFGELLGAMKILTVVSGTKGFVKIPAIAFGLILLGGAIDVITAAVIAMSLLSWESLTKGLAGVGALLGSLSVAVIPLSKNGPGLISAGAGITAIGVGMNFLAHAVKTMGALDLKSLAKGLGAFGASLVILIATLEEMPAANMIAIGTGLIGVGIGMRILASAVAKFATMNAKDIFKGLVSIAAALGIIAGVMELMPPEMPLMAAGILIVAFSLSKIAKAVMMMSGMSWQEIAKGLAALGGSLVILAAALILMEDTIGGAIALGIAAVGIKILASALKTLGGMSWKTLAKGLGVVAIAIGGFAAAAILLSEAIPVMLGLGVALLLLGGGIALLGAGVALIGIGLGAIAASGSAAIGVLIQALIDLSKALPEFGKNLVLGLLEIVQQLSKVAPKFMDALAKIINSLVDLVIREAPKIAIAFIAVIDAILKILHDRQDAIIQAGIDLLIALLNGIKRNIGQVVVIVVDIISRLLNAIAANISKIISAGANIIVSLLKGIGSQINKVVAAGLDLMIKLVQGIVGSYSKILAAAVGIITKFISGLASQVTKLIAAGTNFIVHLITGIGKAGVDIARAGTNAMIKFMNAVVKESLKLGNAGGQAIVNLLNGIAAAIDKYEPQIILACTRIGIAIVTGMIKGMGKSAELVYAKAKEIGGNVLHHLSHPFDFGSPSKVTTEMGQNIILGLVKGMDSNAKDVYSSAETLSFGLINAVKSIFQITSPSKVMYEIGVFINRGLANGLTGSQSDINNAWDQTNKMLLDAMGQARKDIGVEQEKLKKLMADATPDLVAIRKAQIALQQDQDILKGTTNARNALIITMRVQKAELLGLAGDYQRISTQLEKAQQALTDAKKARDDAVAGFTSQYSTLPDIVTTDAEGNAVDQLGTYEEALKHQADAVAAYQSTLDQLRKLGLDDATYQKLLAEGPADQAFATQLLSGGKTAVQGLNKLDKQLEANAKVLAQHAGKNLYQSGVDAAEGLIKGLKSKQSAIYKMMETIAREMVKALNKELNSHSPSKVFAEIGGYAMEGLALGLSAGTKMVTDAVEGAANDALTAMQKSMSGISDMVMSNIDTNPAITPILDLTQVRSQTGELAALTDVSPITAAASYQQASAISSQQSVASTDAPDVAVGGTHVQFVQTNNSPVALSEIEIYRQTKNQLSQFNSAFVGGP